MKHTVLRGETLWSIASDHLGAGDRYPQIAALNTDVLGHRPGFLKPGWVLNLPVGDQQGQRGEHTVTVHRGDTLWEIAQEELGDPSRYPEIFEASQSTTQPGGAHLADPDVIDLGWTLTIPAATTSTTSSGPKPEKADHVPGRSGPAAGTQGTRKPHPAHPIPSRPDRHRRAAYWRRSRAGRQTRRLASTKTQRQPPRSRTRPARPGCLRV